MRENKASSSSRRKKRRYIPEEADKEDEEEEEEEVVLSSSTASGTTTTEEDDEEDVQKKKKKRRGKQPSRETIECAFEQLCAAGKAEEDRKQRHSEKEYDEEKAGGGGKGGVRKGLSIQNLLEMCVKFGYQNWTVLDVENMIQAYELSEAKGEIIRVKNKEDVIIEVTEKGFREIVRKCGVREL